VSAFFIPDFFCGGIAPVGFTKPGAMRFPAWMPPATARKLQDFYCLGNSGRRPKLRTKGLKTRGKRGAIFTPGRGPNFPSPSRKLLMPLTGQ
jgi:hypothetical protein